MAWKISSCPNNSHPKPKSAYPTYLTRRTIVVPEDDTERGIPSIVAMRAANGKLRALKIDMTDDARHKFMPLSTADREPAF